MFYSCQEIFSTYIAFIYTFIYFQTKSTNMFSAALIAPILILMTEKWATEQRVAFILKLLLAKYHLQGTTINRVFSTSESKTEKLSHPVRWWLRQGRGELNSICNLFLVLVYGPYQPRISKVHLNHQNIFFLKTVTPRVQFTSGTNS